MLFPKLVLAAMPVGLVRPEAFYERPVPERHRIIFYVGHLEAFDWNLISQAAG